MADERAIELGSTATAVVIAVTSLGLLGGGALGWNYGGPLAGLLGTSLGVGFGVLAHAIARVVVGSRRLRERPAPDVRELPPDRALQVLGAMLTASGSGSAHGAGEALRAGLLAELGRVRQQIERGDHAGAIASLDLLRETHPRSAAIEVERARVLRSLGRRPEALAATRAAIELALRGGLNRLAAQVFGELGELEAELELDAASWEPLAKALAAQGDQAGATRCRARLE